MMIRQVLIFLILFFSLPVFSGEYEDALKNYDKIFLYFYTKECSYCNKFQPVFEKISESYKDKCKFLKIDANSYYGMKLAQKFHLKFVPYVVLVESKNDRGLVIIPECLLQYVCTSNVVNDFVK